MGTPFSDPNPPAPDPPATITRLLAQMASQGDFPAVGRFLAEVTTSLRLLREQAVLAIRLCRAA